MDSDSSFSIRASSSEIAETSSAAAPWVKEIFEDHLGEELARKAEGLSVTFRRCSKTL